MKCDLSCFNYWSRVTAFVGLVPSVGKCFFNRSFINMNSTNFIRLSKDEAIPTTFVRVVNGLETSVVRNIQFQLIKYVNMGLVKGIARSSSKSNSDADELHLSLGQSYREMLEFSPPSLHSSLHYKFLEYNKSKLKKFHVPWYIPEWLGGLGLVGFKTPSKLDLRCANKILMSQKTPELFMLANTPLFKVHKLVMDRFPARVIKHTVEDETNNFSRLYSSLCIETLFRHQLSEIFDPETNNSAVMRKLRANERLWSSILHAGHLPVPVPYLPVIADDGSILHSGILPQTSFSYLNITDPIESVNIIPSAYYLNEQTRLS
jgi:hypothetical protein